MILEIPYDFKVAGGAAGHAERRSWCATCLPHRPAAYDE